jgi:hypothetical protein
MKQGYTDITIVLDRSGSMADVAADTIGGFNTFLDEQKKNPGHTHLTLRQFDDQHEIVYSRPIAEVPPLDNGIFRPRGSTALLDAIGLAINETGQRLRALPEADRPEHVIVAIITDGLENASRTFTRASVFQMIAHQRDAYKWQFTFIGANQDAITEAGRIGIPQFAALNYSGGPIGTRNAFRGLSNKVSDVGVRGMSISYSEAERSSAMSETEDEPQVTSSGLDTDSNQ